MNKPESQEYNPYFNRYISLVPDGDFIKLLRQSTIEITDFFSGIPQEKHDFRYAEGKWTVKDILMHITDTERVMCYRALAAARGDNKTLLGNMEEDLYAANANVNERLLNSILSEFTSLRASSEIFFENLSDEASKFQAKTETYPITARAIGYILIGHSAHHIQVIKERYL